MNDFTKEELPKEPSLLWRLNWKYGWFKGRPGWYWVKLFRGSYR